MKDFDSWNEIKKNTDIGKNKLYKSREIWWCKFGINIETEQNGRGKLFLRPVLIIKGFSADSCLVAPLTTSQRNHRLRIKIGFISGKNAQVNLSQIKVIDTKRLVEKICFLDKNIFMKVTKNARDLF